MADTTPTSLLGVSGPTKSPVGPFGLNFSAIQGASGPTTTPPTTTSTPPSPVSSPAPFTPVVSQPTGQQSVKTQSGNNQPITTQSTNGPVAGQDTFAMQQVMNIIQNQVENNNQLVTAKNLVLKQLYGEPLTQAEQAQLQQQAPELAASLKSGDRNLIDYNLRLINQQIAGRTNTLDQSISTLTSGYQQQIQNAETAKQDALGVINNALNRSGSVAFAGYPTTVKRQLEQEAGLPVGYLDNVAVSINQQRYGLVPTSTGGASVGGYDLTSYNENPNYSSDVAQIASGIPQITDSTSAQSYISSISPNSPVTGDMVTQAAIQYGVDPTIMMAIMQKESSLGASPVAAADNNYGGITWSQSYQDAHPELGISKGTSRPTSEGGNYVKFATPQQGVMAQAEWLSGHTASSTTDVNPEVQHWANNVKNGIATIAQVPTQYKTAVSDLVDSSPTTSYGPLAASRWTTAANKIVANYINLPEYQLTANGIPYLQRIDAAMKTPGSISDQDLLDSLTKLNTSGNAISDAQVKLITDGQSYSDWASVLKNKFSTGGVLSDKQRTQIQTIANAIYDNYKKGYQPVYDQATAQLKAAGVPQAFWTIPDLNNINAQVGGSTSSSRSNIVTAPDGTQIEIIP